FIPLLVLAIMPLSAGISQELTLREIGYFFVYMILVAFVEEIVFRGIILRILSRKGIITAIFGSSIMFSVAHLMNTLQAKNLESTIIQTLYAFIIGVILAILVIKTNNIILPIIYHYINNVVSSINTNNETLLDLIITYLMFTLAIIYAVYLLNLIKQDNENIAINR
ncbi:MAG: CPBP family intramembrane glutamic endopeptidase, partial [Bacillota bacterium]